MRNRVAVCAYSDEVFFRIFARMTAKVLMMNFYVCPRAAQLAAPTVALEDSLAQRLILASRQPDRYLFRKECGHCVSPLTI